MNNILLIGLSACFFSLGCQCFKGQASENQEPKVLLECYKEGTDIHLGIFNVGSEDILIEVPSPDGEWFFEGEFEDKNGKARLLWSHGEILDNRKCLKVLELCKGRPSFRDMFPTTIHLDSFFVEEMEEGILKKEEIESLQLKRLEVSFRYITFSELHTLKSSSDIERYLLTRRLCSVADLTWGFGDEIPTNFACKVVSFLPE